MLELQENKELLQMLLQGKLLDPNTNALASAMMASNPEERNEVEVVTPDKEAKDEKE